MERFQSKPIHQVTRKRFTMRAGRELWNVTLGFGGTEGGRRQDLSMKLPDGSLVLVNICDQNSVQYEVDALVDLATPTYVERVLMIAVSKEKAKRIERAFQQKVAADEGVASLQEKVRFTDAATVLWGENVAWRDLLGPGAVLRSERSGEAPP